MKKKLRKGTLVEIGFGYSTSGRKATVLGYELVRVYGCKKRVRMVAVQTGKRSEVLHFNRSELKVLK